MTDLVFIVVFYAALWVKWVALAALGLGVCIGGLVIGLVAVEHAIERVQEGSIDDTR